MIPLPPKSTLFPYTTLFRSQVRITIDAIQRIAEAAMARSTTSLRLDDSLRERLAEEAALQGITVTALDRKSTRLNSSHRCISYAVFCLKKKIRTTDTLEFTT